MSRFFKDCIVSDFGFKVIFILLILVILNSSAGAREVNLQWDPNSETDLSHYVVYWGASSGLYSDESGDIGLVTNYTCSLPDDGLIYYFAVTAVDESGLESDYSNEVSTENISVDFPVDSTPDDPVDVPVDSKPDDSAGVPIDDPIEIPIEVPDNNPPVAAAGPDQNVDGKSTVYLDGSNSIDPDGDALTYEWSQTGGPAVTLNGTYNSMTSFDSPSIESEGVSLTFQLIVTDEAGLQSTDSCIINIVSVNNTPIADAGPDQNVNEGSLVYLSGANSSDPDGDSLSYDWIQVSGPKVSLDDSTAVQPIFDTPDIISDGESIVFQLTVTDLYGLQSTDSCVINILSVNSPPVADAGPDQSVNEGSLIYLNGSNSTDPDGDSVSYKWVQISGPAATLDNSAAVQPLLNVPLAGSDGESIVFQLTVTDQYGLQSTDSCIVNIVTVNNPPKADAGADQNVKEGSMVYLDGSGSSDSDGDVLVYQWIQTGGIPVSLNDPASANPEFDTFFVDPEGESLTFQLTVTDPGGLKSTDTCIVNILWVNKPPVADAGPDQDAAEGSFVYLDGSGSNDPDGDRLTFQWIQTGGTAVTLNDPNAAKPYIVSSQNIPSGEKLVFQLTVTDTGGLKSADDCSVIFAASSHYDMTGDWASLYPVERKRKSWISGGFNISNFGSRINQPFNVSFYLSNDRTYDSHDTNIYSQEVSSLAEYEIVNITLNNIKVEDFIIGKYILGIVDSNDEITEDDESNNISSALIR